MAVGGRGWHNSSFQSIEKRSFSMILLSIRRTALLAGFAVFSVLHSNSGQAEAVHTQAYSLGISIQEAAQRGDTTLFAKAFDSEALIQRILHPIDLPDSVRDELRKHLRSQLSAELVAESVAKNGRHFSFVGVRRLEDEYHLLFRTSGPNNAFGYFAYPLGKTAAGGLTLVDVYAFAPPEFVSDTIRRGCLLAVASAGKPVTDGWTPKQLALINSQSEWTNFISQCQAGRYVAAKPVYEGLPASLRADKFILFHRARAAMKLNEQSFLDAIYPWQKTYPNDPALSLVLCDYYWQRNEYQKALPSFEGLNQQLGGDPQLDLRLAKLHEDLGHTNEARSCLWQATRRDPPDPNAFAFLLRLTLLERNFSETAEALTLQGKLFQADMKSAVLSDERFMGFRGSAIGQKWLASASEPLQLGSAALSGNTAADTLKLQGILFAVRNPSAVINGKTVFVADHVGSFKVIKIEAESVTLKSAAGETRMLALR
jgi:hypothetical protein